MRIIQKGALYLALLHMVSAGEHLFNPKYLKKGGNVKHVTFENTQNETAAPQNNPYQHNIFLNKFFLNRKPQGFHLLDFSKFRTKRSAAAEEEKEKKEEENKEEKKIFNRIASHYSGKISIETLKKNSSIQDKIEKKIRNEIRIYIKKAGEKLNSFLGNSIGKDLLTLDVMSSLVMHKNGFCLKTSNKTPIYVETAHTGLLFIRDNERNRQFKKNTYSNSLSSKANQSTYEKLPKNSTFNVYNINEYEAQNNWAFSKTIRKEKKDDEVRNGGLLVTGIRYILNDLLEQQIEIIQRSSMIQWMEYLKVKTEEEAVKVLRNRLDNSFKNILPTTIKAVLNNFTPAQMAILKSRAEVLINQIIEPDSDQKIFTLLYNHWKCTELHASYACTNRKGKYIPVDIITEEALEEVLESLYTEMQEKRNNDIDYSEDLSTMKTLSVVLGLYKVATFGESNTKERHIVENYISNGEWDNTQTLKQITFDTLKDMYEVLDNTVNCIEVVKDSIQLPENRHRHKHAVTYTKDDFFVEYTPVVDVPWEEKTQTSTQKQLECHMMRTTNEVVLPKLKSYSQLVKISEPVLFEIASNLVEHNSFYLSIEDSQMGITGLSTAFEIEKNIVLDNKNSTGTEVKVLYHNGLFASNPFISYQYLIKTNKNLMETEIEMAAYKTFTEKNTAIQPKWIKELKDENMKFVIHYMDNLFKNLEMGNDNVTENMYTMTFRRLVKMIIPMVLKGYAEKTEANMPDREFITDSAHILEEFKIISNLFHNLSKHTRDIRKEYNLSTESILNMKIVREPFVPGRILGVKKEADHRALMKKITLAVRNGIAYGLIRSTINHISEKYAKIDQVTSKINAMIPNKTDLTKLYKKSLLMKTALENFRDPKKLNSTNSIRTYNPMYNGVTFINKEETPKYLEEQEINVWIAQANSLVNMSDEELSTINLHLQHIAVSASSNLMPYFRILAEMSNIWVISYSG